MMMQTFFPEHYEKLQEHAAGAGIHLHHEHSLAIGTPHGFAVMIAERDFHRQDPIAYRSGVTMGACLLSKNLLWNSSDNNCFIMRTNIAKVELGVMQGKVDLLSETMEILGTLPAIYRIHSKIAPLSNDSEVRLFAPSVSFKRQIGKVPNENDRDDEWCIGISWECDNGSDICIGFEFDPTPLDHDNE